MSVRNLSMFSPSLFGNRTRKSKWADMWGFLPVAVERDRHGPVRYRRLPSTQPLPGLCHAIDRLRIPMTTVVNPLFGMRENLSSRHDHEDRLFFIGRLREPAAHREVGRQPSGAAGLRNSSCDAPGYGSQSSYGGRSGVAGRSFDFSKNPPGTEALLCLPAFGRTSGELRVGDVCSNSLSAFDRRTLRPGRHPVQHESHLPDWMRHSRHRVQFLHAPPTSHPRRWAHSVLSPTYRIRPGNVSSREGWGASSRTA